MKLMDALPDYPVLAQDPIWAHFFNTLPSKTRKGNHIFFSRRVRIANAAFEQWTKEADETDQANREH